MIYIKIRIVMFLVYSWIEIPEVETISVYLCKGIFIDSSDRSNSSVFMFYYVS